MKIYVQSGKSAYGETPVRENGTDKRYTLTQAKEMFRSDYYGVTRFLAVHEVPADVVPEKDAYVFKFSWMGSGCVVTTKIVDYETGRELIDNNLDEFLEGRAYKSIKNFFEGG